MSRLNRPTLLLPTRAHGRTQAAENQREQAPTTDPSPVGDICRTEFCAFRKRPGGLWTAERRAASGCATSHRGTLVTRRARPPRRRARRSGRAPAQAMVSTKRVACRGRQRPRKCHTEGHTKSSLT